MDANTINVLNKTEPLPELDHSPYKEILLNIQSKLPLVLPKAVTFSDHLSHEKDWQLPCCGLAPGSPISAIIPF